MAPTQKYSSAYPSHMSSTRDLDLLDANSESALTRPEWGQAGARPTMTSYVSMPYAPMTSPSPAYLAPQYAAPSPAPAYRLSSPPRPQSSMQMAPLVGTYCQSPAPTAQAFPVAGTPPRYEAPVPASAPAPVSRPAEVGTGTTIRPFSADPGYVERRWSAPDVGAARDLLVAPAAFPDAGGDAERSLVNPAPDGELGGGARDPSLAT
mmetsp:Transcript_71700/g.210572  ORF Transcript_71700/g.210572 Transcript_71700/m.210572 type:complete len:207 (-) Transcript_71700:66-686(-)